MPYQKMNLSGQAIYAPKKVYLSKSLGDGAQAPGDEEKAVELGDNPAVNDNMFEIQSREFSSLFGQPNTIPKPFYTPSPESGQLINNSIGCGQRLFMDNETDQQTSSYLSTLGNSSHGLGLLSSVIGSAGPSLLSSANSSFEGHDHSFATRSNSTWKLPSAYYPKESSDQLSSMTDRQVSIGSRSPMSPRNVEYNVSSSVDTRPMPSVSTSQLPSVNARQASIANIASCIGQNLNITGSDSVMCGSGVDAKATETTGNRASRKVETLKDSKYSDQLSASSSSNVGQSSVTISTATCDSTQSPLMFNQSLNSPESWTFSPLVPFSLSHESSYDGCSSPFPVSPDAINQSTLDQLQIEVNIPVSKGTSVGEHFSSPVKTSTESTITWAQKYGINVNSNVKRPSSQPLNRISLADIEEFSGKTVPGKRKCSDIKLENKSLGPPESKKLSKSPEYENCSSDDKVLCSKSSSVILSSPTVSSTDMNQAFSPTRSYQGQNRTSTESSPMPSSTSEVSAVPLKMYRIESEDSNDISSSGSALDCVQPRGCEDHCQVCGDKAAGFYCGAFICEACKKFFMRASKLEKLKYVCLRVRKCVITKESRVQCQYCRFQKCVTLKMYCPGTGDGRKKDKKIGEIPCRVCSAPSSGFHFGALTCEGCKGFFRRMAKERECQRYKCAKSGSCTVNTVTRNLCKACRYRKCLESGMSIEGSRIGRQPNSIKHAISIEAEKQGKTPYKDHIINEEIHINDMEAMVNTAIPATAEELAHIAMTQFDLKSTIDVTPQQVTAQEKNDEEITQFVATEIKQEPQSPAAEVTGPFTMTSSNSSIVDDINCEKTWEILDKCADCNEELETLLPANENNEEDELAEFSSIKKLWINMMDSFEFTARKLIKFSKKVPGFRSISLDDQIKLIQASIYPIVVLNCSRSFDSETKQFSYFNYTMRQREAIHSFFPMLKILSGHFIHTGSMVKLMHFSTMEYTFLSILLLLNADVENLSDSESVRKLQLDTTFALQYHEESNYTDGSTRFGMLLVRLAELHFILIQHNTAIAVMLKKNPELTLPQMYKEMFGEKVLD